MKTLFIKIKQLISNPFVISIGFTVLANLIQVFAFMAQKNLDDENFALLNWGVYVFTFLNIPLESLLKWVTIKLGSIDMEKRIRAIFNLVRRTIIPVYILIFIFSIPFIFIKSQSAYIGALCFFSAILGYWSIFPRAYLNVKEKFIEFNLLLLIIPIIRLIFTILFVFNGSVYLLFYGLNISSVIAALLSIIFVCKDSGLTLSSVINYLKGRDANDLADDSIIGVFGNVFIQIALSVFYIADGILLKNILSDYDYSVYVSYSYIYKFPMFAAIGVAPVLLGKSVLSEANRIELKKTLRKSILIIFGLFGSFLLIEILFEGKLLELLGYSRYFKQGFSFIFGLAWLVQTLVYFVFTYLLKIKANWKTYVAIFLYSLSFIIGLYVFRDSIFSVMWFVLGQGLFFIIVNFALLLKK